MTEHVDVLIVGAGLSGIGAALPPAGQLPRARPTPSSRAAPPSAARGTCSATPASARTPTCTRWATRSSPWTDAKAIADGPVDPRTTSRDTAAENGIDAADPLQPQGRGGLVVERRRRAGRSRPTRGPGRSRRASRATSCSRAAATTTTTTGYTPDFPGRRALPAARVVHPQYWTEDVDYAGKRVVVIGSGATAVTLVPEMARTGRARHHAPALADLHRLACPARTRSPTGCASRARAGSPTASRGGRTCCSACSSTSSRGASAARRRRRLVDLVAPGARPRLRRRAALHAGATTRGTSASAWCPTAICSTSIRSRARLGRHRSHRDLHRDRHPARAPARSCRPTSSSPPPASSCSSSAAWTSRSTAAGSISHSS